MPRQPRYGFFFRRREVRQGLVAPDVERAHGYRFWCERLKNLAIDLVLLLFHRKSLTCHERKLGAIEPDLVDAEVCGDIHVGQQANVQPQSHMNLVSRRRLEIA